MVTFSNLGKVQFGRLGNQLFQIAATIGIAEKNGMGFFFPEWKYSKYFENKLPTNYCDDCKVYKAEGTNYYEVKLDKGNWDLEGFFQSEKFFINSRATILTYLQPTCEVDTYLNSKYGHILNSNTTCSVHIRRGDYLKQKYYFPPQPLAYYKEAISLFDEKTKFVIFSDDIAWCKENFEGDNYFFVDREEDIIDLILMSKCDHHIIPNSSFSWWAAWINNKPSKRVICPEYWFGPGVALNFESFTKDIFAAGFQKLILPKTSLREKYAAFFNPLIYIYCYVLRIFNTVYNFLASIAKFFLKPLLRR